MAFAQVYNFVSVSKESTAGLPDRETKHFDETAQSKEHAEAKQMNAVAMANFCFLLQMETLMVLVYAAMTAEWPTGLAHRVMTALYRIRNIGR